MKTIGVGAVLGILLGGIIVFVVGFQNPSSEVLVVIMCIAVCTAALNAIKRPGAKNPEFKEPKP